MHFPPPPRSRRFAAVAAASALATLTAVACTGGDEPKRACTTAVECDVDEACRGGVCVANTPFDAGTEPRDAGAGDEDAAITSLCQKVASCSSDPGSVQECVTGAHEQFEQLRSIGTSECDKAAADLGALYACATQATCDQLSDTAALSQLCPVFDLVNTEINQCQGGEGEGEGEGEGCFVPGFDPNSTSAEVFLLDVRAQADAEPLPECETFLSASIFIDVDGDATAAINGAVGISSFDSQQSFELVNMQAIDSTVIVATACNDNDFIGSSIAVQLLLADGSQTNAVCGRVESP